tara:strand:+ start:839 stop:991 length:153 start_codon:yes stop_codon:yes gene_type:complete
MDYIPYVHTSSVSCAALRHGKHLVIGVELQVSVKRDAKPSLLVAHLQPLG